MINNTTIEDISEDGKTCNKCDIWKNYSEFHKEKNSKDGYRTECKLCKNTLAKKHYLNNRGNIKVKRKQYRKNNLEYLKEYDKNRNKLPHRKLKNKQRNQLPHYKRLHAARRHKRRILEINAEGAFTGNEVKQLLKNYYNKCYWCLKTLDKYHLDHFIPISKGGSNYIYNIVPSCPTCNLKKNAKLPQEFKPGEKEKPLSPEEWLAINYPFKD